MHTTQHTNPEQRKAPLSQELAGKKRGLGR